MYSCADFATPLRKGKRNVLVSHSNSLITAGLVATLEKISGCTVHTDEAIAQRGHGGASRVIDLLVVDAMSLNKAVASWRRLCAPVSSSEPQVVLLTTDDENSGTVVSPSADVDARISMHCRQEDLMRAVCRMIGAAVPARFLPLPARIGALSGGGIAPAALRRVRQHIDEHLSDHIQLSTLAAYTGLSVCHFSRAFKQSLGVPPHRYLISRRIEAAARLIESSDRALSDIALEVGFSDQSHFTRVFSARVGVSPRLYRHNLR